MRYVTRRLASLDRAFARALPGARIGGLGWGRSKGYTLRADDARVTVDAAARRLARVRGEGEMHGYMTADGR